MRITDELSQQTDVERLMQPRGEGQYPSVDALREAVNIVKNIIFPDFFDRPHAAGETRRYFIGVDMVLLHDILYREIGHALRFDTRREVTEAEQQGFSLATQFMSKLPELKRLLYSDVQAIADNDPAVRNYAEIILSYPVVTAMVYYRVAHALFELGIPVIPRMITEQAHSLTGIDIHPGATIGDYFAIDHGTGVVIGETCIIGSHVTIYQGVTLGARHFSYDESGHPVNVPRHPILEDNVTVYANATVLGRITVGEGSVIGGNVWLTQSVPAHSRVVQGECSHVVISENRN
ncbi:MAG: serine acetyltransferase [Muribaculaceae bacterium]|nr:serine acetyltransferase [Muribaculaceae bacterium]